MVLNAECSVCVIKNDVSSVCDVKKIRTPEPLAEDTWALHCQVHCMLSKMTKLEIGYTYSFS